MRARYMRIVSKVKTISLISLKILPGRQVMKLAYKIVAQFLNFHFLEVRNRRFGLFPSP